MSEKNWFKIYVVDVLPLLSALVCIGGFSSLGSYYLSFGINILYYITLSEVATFISVFIGFSSVLCFFVFLLNDFLFEALRRKKRYSMPVSIVTINKVNYHLDETELYELTKIKHSLDWLARMQLRIYSFRLWIYKMRCKARKFKAEARRKNISANKKSIKIKIKRYVFEEIFSCAILFYFFFNIHSYFYSRGFRVEPLFIFIPILYIQIEIMYQRWRRKTRITHRILYTKVTKLLGGIIFIIMACIGLSICGFYNADLVKMSRSPLPFELYMRDCTPSYLNVNNQNLSFIGCSSTSIFLYNSEHKKTVIIRSDIIEKIVWDANYFFHGLVEPIK